MTESAAKGDAGTKGSMGGGTGGAMSKGDAGTKK